jgi:hypothetical protein
VSPTVVHTAQAGGQVPALLEGDAVLPTRSRQHAHYLLHLPGKILFSQLFTYKALISHNTLLKHDFKICLDVHHSHVTTPNGDFIDLIVCNGLYHFLLQGPTIDCSQMPVAPPPTIAPTAPQALTSIPEELSLSPALEANLAKWDVIHCTFGHPAPHHMGQLALACHAT